MFKIVSLALLIVLHLNASGDSCIEGFKTVSKYYKINTKIMVSIADIESGLNPYAMLLKSRSKKAIIHLLKTFKIKYKESGRYISVLPQNKNEAKAVFSLLIKQKKKYKIFDYDLGIMQVNRKNFYRYGVSEKEYYFNCGKNILLGGDILRRCFNKFKNTKKLAQNTIECYHRGTSYETIKNSNYSYFNRFFGKYKLASAGE